MIEFLDRWSDILFFVSLLSETYQTSDEIRIYRHLPESLTMSFIAWILCRLWRRSSISKFTTVEYVLVIERVCRKNFSHGWLLNNQGKNASGFSWHFSISSNKPWAFNSIQVYVLEVSQLFLREKGFFSLICNFIQYLHIRRKNTEYHI